MGRAWLGNFKTPEIAALAYDLAALHFFEDFARINFLKKDVQRFQRAMKKLAAFDALAREGEK